MVLQAQNRAKPSLQAVLSENKKGYLEAGISAN